MRLRKPSLVRMWSTCASTVLTERNSRAAMSRLVRPRAASAATSVSRRVRVGRGPGSAASSGSFARASRTASSGLSRWPSATSRPAARPALVRAGPSQWSTISCMGTGMENSFAARYASAAPASRSASRAGPS